MKKLVNPLRVENILLVMANRVFFLLSALLSVALLGRVEAECANACNGHGKCTSYDMCICHRNWQANDCSERVCMHGLAHVDTPKVSTWLSGTHPGSVRRWTKAFCVGMTDFDTDCVYWHFYGVYKSNIDGLFFA